MSWPKSAGSFSFVLFFFLAKDGSAQYRAGLATDTQGAVIPDTTIRVQVGGNMARNILFHILATIVCLMLFVFSAQAQFRASLRGTVTDPQGAVVAGAKVSLVDTQTNRTLVSTSDANGIYQFNALPPGTLSAYCGSSGLQAKGA